MPDEPGFLMRVGAAWETVSRFVPKVWRRWRDGYDFKSALFLSVDEFEKEINNEEEEVESAHKKAKKEYDDLTRRLG